MGQMNGLVVKCTGTWYTVLSDEGTLENCTVKGNFRLKGIRSTSPVVIGDRVKLSEPSEGDGARLITEIEERKNCIARKSINLSKQSHILAANLDLCMLIATISHPVTTTTFIDRFLANAEAYDIPAVLVFNKIDIYSEEDKQLLKAMIDLYEHIGYHCLAVSASHGEGMDQLRSLLEGKITLLSGHSGVGKSTIVNTLIPDLNLRTSQISDAYDTGKHTTTYSEMYKFGTSFIIDTPGIKGFGTFDMEKEDVGDYFKEIFEYSKDCRFNNCTHTHEPGCAVIEAVKRHDISESRYNSYLSMLEDENESKYREGY